MSRPIIPTGAALAAKLSPPASVPGHVCRQAVVERVASSAATVVLFRAPAGFGKTTAMVQCRDRLEARGVATAWLTLDGSDNDASRFLACLSAAAATITDEDASGLIPGGDGASRWLGELALEVVRRLAGHPSPFALFLDDFEAIQDPGALALVREIVSNLPRCGRLLVGSRSLPDLSLGRLRAREQLLEIDARDLRFSIEETAEFLSRRGPAALPAGDVSRLHQKTEGWPAALSLASMALDRHDAPAEFIERFSGSNAAVAEYLADDVLARQPPEVRRFLLRTSLLRELHAPLCRALVTQEDAEELLVRLERGNLFLTPIAGAERTWRYHSLFATFLRSQLARELPDEVPALHRAASAWYESEGRPVPAVDHALQAGDYERAVGLVAGEAERLLALGRLRLLGRWFGTLPRDVLRRHPVLQVIEAWALALTRGPREAMALLQRSGQERSKDPAVAAYVLALRPMLLAMMDRYEEAHAAGRESLERLPEGNQFARMALANAMAEIFSVMGRHDDARRLLDTARRAQGERESAFNVMYSESVEGLIDLQEGRLRQAAARFRIAVGASHVPSSPTSVNAWAGVLHALTVYEANDLDQAARLLGVYVPLVRDVGLPDHMLLGYGMLSRIAFVRGDVDEAFQTLTELEYLGQRRQLARVVAGAKLERARLLLLQSHGVAAARELERADDRRVWERAERLRHVANDLETLELGRLRWEVLAGEPRKALPALEREIAAADAAARGRRALKLRLLRAAALGRSGEERESLRLAAEVLRAAAAEGFVRLVLDEGEAAGVLVRRVEARLREEYARPRDPTFGEYLQRLLAALGPDVSEAEVVSTEKNAALLEPLTAKEITVLQLLAEGYSNGAMAEKLAVADTTIRTHLRSINGKLGARSRTHAVALARRLRIIA
jgi:LuxR family maltose regulon positive regulatory protein